VRLPNTDRALIEPAKIRDYLLSEEHPDGRHKRAVFRALGYDAQEWERLADDLRTQHLPLDAVPRLEDEYGQRYEIRGRLRGPNGRVGVFISAWIVKTGDDAPTFLSAYPG
jgi:hypothetical protein